MLDLPCSMKIYTIKYTFICLSSNKYNRQICHFFNIKLHLLTSHFSTTNVAVTNTLI